MIVAARQDCKLYFVGTLRQGVGVKTIGDLLGHHSLESTCVYLRIETDMLRTVALAVPVSAAR